MIKYFPIFYYNFEWVSNEGISVFVKQPGTASLFFEGLVGMVEYISKNRYLYLLETKHHWGLYVYNNG